MSAKRLTESAMLSSLFVMTGIIFISSFIGYQIYLDFMVPILITLIYLRCDFKYTLLSSIISVILITFVFGNPAYTLWMIQNMTIGFVCGLLIKKDTGLMDDLFYCSIFAAIVLIFADIFLSGIIGSSLITEAQEFIEYFSSYPVIKDVIFYLVLAALPLGNVIMTYLIGLILGKKLRILNYNGLRKYFFIKKYRKYGSIQYCSKRTMIIGVIYIIFMFLIGKENILFKVYYFKTVLITIYYIILYFIIKDSYIIVTNYVYKLTAKTVVVSAFQLTALYSLFTYFTITSCALIIGATVIDLRFNIRKNTEGYLKKSL